MPRYPTSRPVRRYVRDPLGQAKRKEVSKIAKSVLSRRSETKCFPIFSSSANVAVSTSGVFTSLTNITQGASNFQRVGNEVTLSRIRFHMTIAPSQGAGADDYNRVRVIIFRWKEDDAINSPTAINEILDNASSGAGLVGVDWPVNYQDRSDYEILYDKVHTLNPMFAFTSAGAATTDWAQSDAKTIRVNKRLNHKVVFNGTATEGHSKLYLLVMSDSSAPAHPSYGFAGQILYKDS